MKRSKEFTFALFVLLLFAVGLTAQAGCASSGNKKPILYVDQPNFIPADIPSQFLDRYYFLVDKEKKEFKKLLTDEDRQVFIDKFWIERDTDPMTPENEYKEKIDERIDDIANERFFGTSVTTGLLFRSNRGFRGDMAKVYLLHGEPDAMDILEGRSFVDLMLWLYINPENGNILYAFLFYDKGGSGGTFYLFSQDIHKLDFCGAVNEITKNKDHGYFSGLGQACPAEVEQVYQKLQEASGKGGILEGYMFAWALFNFSQDSTLLQGSVLGPPKPASEIAKDSKSSVTGEASKMTGVVGTDYVFASCDKCNSFIPAELRLGKEFVLFVRRGDIDWRVVGDQAEVSLKLKIVLENVLNEKFLVFESKEPIKLKNPKNLIISDPSGQIVVQLLSSDEVFKIPEGTYRVNIYVKNEMTKKYNSWQKEFEK